MRGTSLIKWAGLVAGALFGAFGWGMLKLPATEDVGTVLFLFPSLIFGGRGVTDAQAIPFTTCLYALLGLVAGWLLGRFLEKRPARGAGPRP
jgi:hypothetical protein